VANADNSNIHGHGGGQLDREGEEERGKKNQVEGAATGGCGVGRESSSKSCRVVGERKWKGRTVNNSTKKRGGEVRQPD